MGLLRLKTIDGCACIQRSVHRWIFGWMDRRISSCKLIISGTDLYWSSYLLCASKEKSELPPTRIGYLFFFLNQFHVPRVQRALQHAALHTGFSVRRNANGPISSISAELPTTAFLTQMISVGQQHEHPGTLSTNKHRNQDSRVGSQT